MLWFSIAYCNGVRGRAKGRNFRADFFPFQVEATVQILSQGSRDPSLRPNPPSSRSIIRCHVRQHSLYSFFLQRAAASRTGPSPFQETIYNPGPTASHTSCFSDPLHPLATLHAHPKRRRPKMQNTTAFSKFVVFFIYYPPSPSPNTLFQVSA